MGLRDQLLKAGLVTKKQALQSESAKKKQEHDIKKSKELEEKLTAQSKSDLQAIEQEKAHRIELDKELNRKRDQMIAQRESYYRSMQLLNSNNLLSRSAGEMYFFAEGKVVRKIMVTAWQKEMLARGKLGIGKPMEEVDEFVLVPLDCAKMIMQIYPSKIITLHSELNDEDEIDFEQDNQF